ncbi:hypothetical protein MKI84_15110 [Ancylobacter sp. A5.8]|uniref:hypothetical protein n=1 Tax=Ancylobacter gelatini TaxID=2919920 RepID=UPI001F4DB75D|nr:hypothetical protein [Ancylobacter gelatini]
MDGMVNGWSQLGIRTRLSGALGILARGGVGAGAAGLLATLGAGGAAGFGFARDRKPGARGGAPVGSEDVLSLESEGLAGNRMGRENLCRE